jgi:tripartite ATP-independent transporter DctM subunit
MFLAGLVPGVLLGGFLIVAIYILARFGFVTAPTSPQADRSEVWTRFVAALPALCAPVFLLAGLFLGIATPTELGALLVIYAIVLGLVQGEMRVPDILAALTATARACGVLVLIIAAAVPLGWIIAVDGVSGTMAEFLVSMTDSPATMLLMVAAILLVAGMFIETAALLLISVPIFLPTALLFGVDPVHFGIVLILTVLIGAVTPPFGLILFVTMNISGISFGRMCRAILPFYVPMLMLLILIILVPGLSLFLPRALGAP